MADNPQPVSSLEAAFKAAPPAAQYWRWSSRVLRFTTTECQAAIPLAKLGQARLPDLPVIRIRFYATDGPVPKGSKGPEGEGLADVLLIRQGDGSGAPGARRVDPTEVEEGAADPLDLPGGAGVGAADQGAALAVRAGVEGHKQARWAVGMVFQSQTEEINYLRAQMDEKERLLREAGTANFFQLMMSETGARNVESLVNTVATQLRSLVSGRSAAADDEIAKAVASMVKTELSTQIQALRVQIETIQAKVLPPR